MFCLRVDIDSRFGLLNGVPKLLEALRKQDAKASFYVPMGGESTLPELLRHRGGERGAAGGVKLPALEILRMCLLPRNFAEENITLLKRITDEGHELGVHGWKHRAWTRSLASINAAGHVALATRKFEELFGRKPKSFAAPAFKTSRTVLEALDAFGYSAAGDLEGDAPFKPVVGGKEYSCVQVPITLKMPNTDPLIEAFSLQGMNDNDVVARVCGMIDELEARGKLASLYCHDLFEGTAKPHVVEAVLAHVKMQGYELSTVEKIGAGATARKQIVF